MKKTLGVGYLKVLLLATVIAILIVTTGYSYVNRGEIIFIDEVENGGTEDLLQTNELDLSNSYEYKSWKNTADTTFKSLYNGNQAEDILAMRPEMVILWAGYGFSKSYLSPRGHMYAIEDLYHSLRTGAPRKANEGPQPASCWACKSLDVLRLIDEVGSDGFYKKKWYDWGSEVVNPVGCGDCHDPESMDLRVPRQFLIDALKREGDPIEDASDRRMRSLVCAQCHAEYYLKGENKEVVLPWDSGYTVEAIENYYDKIGFSDYVNKLSRTPMLKAQHPDFELAQMGIHARRGVSCGECHMPYVEEELRSYNNHHIQSPLAMIEKHARPVIMKVRKCFVRTYIPGRTKPWNYVINWKRNWRKHISKRSLPGTGERRITRWSLCSNCCVRPSGVGILLSLPMALPSMLPRKYNVF